LFTYPHHIRDFNNATLHLTRHERSIYLDLIHLYYDTEKPLPTDLSYLCKKIRATDGKHDLQAVELCLSEFFILTDNGYFHATCALTIDAFHNMKHGKAIAGKASAEAKKAKKAELLAKQSNTLPTEAQQKSTPVELRCNETSTEPQQESTNLERITYNVEPIIKTLVDSDESTPVREKIPFDSIKDLFNKICISLPKIIELSDKRKSAIKFLWNRSEKYKNLETWEAYFNYVEQSDFLCNRNQKTNWIANFDFIVNKTNHLKICEGNFHAGI